MAQAAETPLVPAGSRRPFRSASTGEDPAAHRSATSTCLRQDVRTSHSEREASRARSYSCATGLRWRNQDLFRLDAGCLDHPLPALEVLREPGAELGGRAAALSDRAELVELLPGLPLGERSTDCLVQQADDRRRKAGRADDAEALRVLLEPREAAFRHGRHVRVVGMALFGADREHLEAFLLHLLRNADHRIE